MGQVYRARDTKPDRDVAIKIRRQLRDEHSVRLASSCLFESSFPPFTAPRLCPRPRVTRNL